MTRIGADEAIKRGNCTRCAGKGQDPEGAEGDRCPRCGGTGWNLTDPATTTWIGCGFTSTDDVERWQRVGVTLPERAKRLRDSGLFESDADYDALLTASGIESLTVGQAWTANRVPFEVVASALGYDANAVEAGPRARPTAAVRYVYPAEGAGCQGHPAGPSDPMGETVYCDGSCVAVSARRAVGPSTTLCPACQGTHGHVHAVGSVSVEEFEPGRGEDGERCDQCSAWLGRWWVNAYQVARLYGGSEEGGWWYDVGVPLASVPVLTAEDEATARTVLGRSLADKQARRDRFQTNGGPDLDIVAEGRPAEAYPRERPHYE